MRGPGDFRPEEVPSKDMDEYARRAFPPIPPFAESMEPKDVALRELLRIQELEYDEKYGKGAYENLTKEEKKKWKNSQPRARLSPSWGQRGNFGVRGTVNSQEMLQILGNTARTKILIELFNIYTHGSGRLTSSDLCGRLNIGKSTASRILRDLSNNGMVSIGKGGKGHCLDGTTQRGERFILTMNSLEGKTRTDEIKNRIEWQRRIRDAKYFDYFRNKNGDDKTRLFCTAIGESTPWIYNNLPPEFEDCMTIPEPKSSFEKRYDQWRVAMLRRMGILYELDDQKWKQRKKIFSSDDDGFSLFSGVSNSRISQLLKEFVDKGIIERKRGEGRGEMLYRITKKGLLQVESYGAPGAIGHLRALPYGGSWVEIEGVTVKELKKGESWAEIQNIVDSDFDWEKYAEIWEE